ncbi:PTS lactose transporter subunit IIC [Thermoanaerobacterium sp. PSU-2]|nr:PTS lactose transporter subunit IIC [Thermoanaerobacterium sp. PSU-2]
MDAITQKVVPMAGRIQSNKYLKAITEAFMATMPALMAGAIFSLIVSAPFGAGYTAFLEKTNLKGILNAGVSATTDMIALYLVIALGYQFGKAFNKDVFSTSVVSLLSFILVTPFSTTVVDSAKKTIPVNSVIPINWLGAQGIFTALIVGILATYIYSFIVDRNWKIKMPDSVPPMVSQAFEAVIPGIITATIFLIVRAIFSATSFGSLSQFIYKMLETPLTGLGNSFTAFIISIFVIQILWALGVHGTLVVLSVMMAVWTGPMMADQSALAAGKPIPYMLTLTFMFAVNQWIGGPGLLLGLATNMALFAKSSRYKTLGKLALLPNVFNIIEPIVFGFPIVLNPIMFIPFVLTPVIAFTIGYLLMKIHIIGIPAIALPSSVFTMPFIPGGFLLGAGVGFGIYLILMYLLSVVLYFPFFKIADRIALKEEEDVKAVNN